MSEKNYSPPRAQQDGELGPECCSLEAALASILKLDTEELAKRFCSSCTH